VNMRSRFVQMIEREIAHAKKGKPARVIFKTNALVDRRLIGALYRASQAGVKVDLLVRGICCLRPGLPGISENITVTSIVGRFLEHSRVYYFRNAGAEEIYIGSADLMPRNIDHRVEVLFPIEEPKMIERIRDDVLSLYLGDTVKARLMQPDGTYVRRKAPEGRRRLNAQEYLIGRRSASEKPKKARLPRKP
jgi:polyphosphate kinase